ncbi:hypothetical protein [Mesorhizobium sp. M5C.F.Ca.IN.020.29.1.1]|nr:hypothetical protein [Mesorhizobium sp. M5C.F.Ca.IN.020.29.1.1]
MIVGGSSGISVGAEAAWPGYEVTISGKGAWRSLGAAGLRFAA